MNLIVCVDERNGMAFSGRRLSKDCVVLDKIKNLCSSKRLFLNTYTANLFDVKDNLCIDDKFLELANEEDWCFAENVDVSAYADSVKSVVLFNWNRKYPFDLTFPMEIYAQSWKLVGKEEFSGYSHDKITMEVYVL